MRAALLDPSINSHNLGDLIIRESVLKNLPDSIEISDFLPTQIPMSKRQLETSRTHRLAFVGGTNLLSSNMPWYRQWKLDRRTRRAVQNKVVLMGVGWWQYQNDPNTYTRRALQAVLSKELTHSVRDEYTKRKLETLDLNVINTACPTMWGLEQITPSCERPEACVVTLTDYNRDKTEDQWLVDQAAKYYKKVFIWPQSIRDASYGRELAGHFELLAPTLSAYEHLLGSTASDYIGTRLHGGVRAFQAGHWGLIVAVDNRAVEIGRDTRLPVFARGDRTAISDALSSRGVVDIKLPHGSIEEWRTQFEPTVRQSPV